MIGAAVTKKKTTCHRRAQLLVVVVPGPPALRGSLRDKLPRQAGVVDVHPDKLHGRPLACEGVQGIQRRGAVGAPGCPKVCRARMDQGGIFVFQRGRGVGGGGGHDRVHATLG